MKNIAFVAFKNLARHKKRTFITCIAIAFGIAYLIWVDGMLTWADNESKRNLKHLEYGNFIVSAKEYAEDRNNFPLDSVIEKAEAGKILQIADKTGASAAPRTGFRSMVSYNRRYGLPYVVFAIDPEADAGVFRIKDNIVEGEYPAKDGDGILISAYCSKELGAGLGDYVVMETRTRHNTMQAIQLRVTGIYDCPNPQVNKHHLFITRTTACLLYTSPSPRDRTRSRMPSSA